MPPGFPTPTMATRTLSSPFRTTPHRLPVLANGWNKLGKDGRPMVNKRQQLAAGAHGIVPDFNEGSHVGISRVWKNNININVGDESRCY